MTDAQTVATNALKEPSKTSSLLAKCTAPFARPKKSNHVDQEIRLDEPFRQFFPGDTVKGAVHACFGKPLRITHLTIRLHGFVKVIGRAKLPGEEINYDEKLFATRTGKGRRGIEYYGNGFISLFDDELVLCGEGSVHGKYVFGFQMILPSKNVPSSVNFEHGAITYMLSSTVTRSTAIAATSVSHRKLNVQEMIDVASVPRPRLQLLSVESVHKGTKIKLRGRTKGEDLHQAKLSVDSASTRHSVRSSDHRINDVPPLSPVPSEISSASGSGSSASSHNDCRTVPMDVINGGGDVASRRNSRETAACVKTEVLLGGCLAGDIIPLKISIQHTKPLKNMHGIIITLFRQGRIDAHPALPLGPNQKGKNPRYDEYYPRSRTGLGGLSLSSAGSSRVFRQDLNQIFQPIIVDPLTLDAIINTSIEVPIDVFPTINCVPGAMISFNYFVEVVVDLRTKVSSQDRIRPHLAMTSAVQHSYGDPRFSRHNSADGVSYSSTLGFNYLITDQLRRTKGVVSMKSEIIIGTRDSMRKSGKHKTEQPSEVVRPRSMRSSVELGRELEPLEEGTDQVQIEGSDEGQIPLNNLDHHHTLTSQASEVEREVDEKERMRRAEERLLPSAPLPDTEQSLGSSAPTAPQAYDSDDFVQRYALRAPAPAYNGPSVTVSSESPLPSTAKGHMEDKQELERQRLLAMTSSPAPEHSGSYVPKSNSRLLQASAPSFVESDLPGVNDHHISQSSASLSFAPHAPSNSQHPNTVSLRLRDSDVPVVSNATNLQQSNDPSTHHENLPVYER